MELELPQQTQTQAQPGAPMELELPQPGQQV
jgi:hypothetical protein